MDGTFVDELRASLAVPLKLTANGKERTFLPPDWTEKEPPALAVPKAIALGTLSGLVNYCEANIDKLPVDAHMVHVESHAHVALLGRLEEPVGTDQFRRATFVRATSDAEKVNPLRVGQYMDIESFIIGLQAGCVQTAARDELVTFVGSIRESGVRDTVDSGYAQEVKTARGVVFKDRAQVPNPVALAPWWTFPEIEQPESKFVLRLRAGQGDEGPSCALFIAEGQRWQAEAMKRIAAYLEARLPVGFKHVIA